MAKKFGIDLAANRFIFRSNDRNPKKGIYMRKRSLNFIITYLLLTLILFYFEQNAWPSSPKTLIAVASVGPELHCSVCNQAARAPYFLIFDSSGRLIKTLSNPYAKDLSMAGPKVARFLSDNGVKVLVADKIGFKMERALLRLGLIFFQVTGTAKDAVTSVTSTMQGNNR